MSDETFPTASDEEVRAWLARQGLTVEDLADLTGDVSLRHYSRVSHGGETAIVAIYPPEIRSSCRNFLESSRLLSRAGVRVPQIHASDCVKGLMLLEDAGTDTLYDLRDRAPAFLSACFWRAVSDLKRIQTLAVNEVAPLNPPLDRDLLWRELDQTWTTLFERRSLLNDPGFAHTLRESLTEICRALDEDHQVPCHRDFMARNFVPLGDGPELVVLDHQDLRLGPQHYDLASLLNDSLFPDPALEEEILLYCLGDEPIERIRYHRAAAQRTLKATGTYESFALRGNTRHQKLIPGTLRRALEHLSRLPEMAAVIDDLEERMAPLLIC
jgi:aminoglycoside/choline kinase family phosphotransferase